MSKIVKFPTDFYDMGVVKYAAGSYHPLNSETQSLVNSGYAEMIDSDDTVDHIEVLTALAKIAVDRANAARQVADELEYQANQAIDLARTAAGTNPNAKAAADQAAADKAAADQAAADKAAADQAAADKAAADQAAADKAAADQTTKNP